MTAVSEVAAGAAAAQLGRILDELERAIVGKRDVLELVLLGLVADGHVLLDDLPGVAKTLIARSLATVTGLEFRRVQFTPDLLPGDITGATVLDPASGQFTFRAGPVFGNLLLADEVNRTPAKTQTALLEAMQERQVTVDGVTHPLPHPFLVVATQNPIEHEGTYPLPEAQLDRFLLRTRVGYPAATDEEELLARRVARGQDDVALEQVCAGEDVVGLQRTVERVHVDPAIVAYVVALVRATRHDPQLEVGASPRGSLALLRLARAHALARGRDYVDPDDVKAVLTPALAHRLVLRSELWVRGVPAEDVLAATVANVTAPSWR
ncbi:MAG TPA: MoxR family ATPase [Acidimicrobiales bacterium]|nr:MoxR family ATPase [Acidimicrobiales bacterium]